MAASTSAKVQETLRRIRAEAIQKVVSARYSRSKLPKPKLLEPKLLEPKSVEQVADLLREQLTTAVAQALSTKSARRYVGELNAKLQDLASDVISTVKARQKFGGAETDDSGIIIYPNNCKLLLTQAVNGAGLQVTTPQNQSGSLIIEEQPQQRTIFALASGKYKPYRIAMPYLVYAIGFRRYSDGGKTFYTNSGMGLGFRREPITSIDDSLLVPKIPHVNGNTHICQPLSQHSFPSIKEMAEEVVKAFWNTRFHYSFRDAGCHFYLADGSSIDCFYDWQTKIKNPLDILNARFSEGNTIREVLTAFGGITESSERNTVVSNVQSSVNAIVRQFSNDFSADDLTNIIRETAEQIVNVALQNAVEDSALRH